MKKRIGIITILSILSMMSACAAQEDTNSALPHYNSSTSNTYTSEKKETVDTESTYTSTQNDTTSSDADPYVSDSFPIIETKNIACGNNFEQQQFFGFYCKSDDGFYYVERTADGFLYHYKNGEVTLVLEEYTRALHYFEGKIYYLKGSKEQFNSQNHFYGGDVWCYDTGTGEESCVVSGVSNNLCLVVNEYGIFCNPNDGGIAMYDFNGNLIKVLSEINQNIYILDNYIYLKRDHDFVLQNLTDDTTVVVPEMSLIVSYHNGKIVYADEKNQSLKYVADMKSGDIHALPANEAFSYAWHDDQLYASDNQHIYSVNLKDYKYEPIVTLKITDPIQVFCLFDDDETLYAEAVNQSDRSVIAEVQIESNSLKF